MDTLEQKIQSLLNQIKTPQSNFPLAESDILNKLTLHGKTAKIWLNDSSEEQVHLATLQEQITTALLSLEEIDEVVFEGPLQSVPYQKTVPTSYLQNYKYIILVASGKGGVGKSTVATNLAIALQKQNKKVALLDADIYGPSIPTMLGKGQSQATILGNQIQPLSTYNIEFMSVGNLIADRESVILRGPMIHQVLEQILRDTLWSGGDYMIVDMPPGTGDVQISLAQLINPSGAVIVSTSQDIALLDAQKAITMLQKTNIPLLGMIENMSTFLCPHCQKESSIFGEDGVLKESQIQNVPLLGKIPLSISIRKGGDEGKPFMSQTSDLLHNTFLSIVEKINSSLSKIA